MQVVSCVVSYYCSPCLRLWIILDFSFRNTVFAQYQAYEYGVLNHTLSQDLFITSGQLCSVLEPPLDPLRHHPLVEKQ